MSHAITQRKNGFSEIAYVGEKPWHGLGQELKEGAPIEEWLVAAGMDWKIQRSRVRYAIDGNGGPLKTWDDYHVLMRNDTHAPLGMVSPTYKVVQPRETLEFFRDLVEHAGFKLCTAGTLHGGRKFWALADIHAEDRIVGNDLVRGRLMLASSCDGSMNTIAKNVAERVVCANTLAIAMGERGAPEVRVSHRTRFDAVAVKKQLGVAVTSFERFIKDARTLAARRVNATEAQAFVAKVIGKQEQDIADVLDSRPFKSIMELFNGAGRGSMLPGSLGTAWGLVNAVTEYADHYAQARSLDNRLNSAWFHGGDAMKREAMEEALVLVR